MHANAGLSLEDSPHPNPLSNREGSTLGALAISAALLLAVAWVFGQTTQHEFINLDDDVCVYENPQITRGLTKQGIRWAFTSRLVGNWDPITWISHMVDWQFYGSNAGGHHRTNVLLHAATVLLLFLILRRMTGDLWPSALAAALFAIHPLRIESVAWITERKDVLSGLFFMLTLWAYTSYVQRRSWLTQCLAYAAMIGFFVLGLMSKPMLVTLPCVLLLLDYWPLGRMRQRPAVSTFARLVVEKLPLFAMTAGLCIITYWAQRVTLHKPKFPVSRISDAVVFYVTYLGQFFYPVGLATPYPRRELDPPGWMVVGAILLLGGITALVWILRRKSPYFLIGWLWYLGMMLPVIGLLPFGAEVTADRFTYLPQIGIALAMAWGLVSACRWRAYLRWACGVASVLALAALILIAHKQTSYWRNSETLWAHTLACTSNNFTAHRLYGNVLAAQERLDEAEQQYRAAIAANPNHAEAHYSLGVVADTRGLADEAITHYQMAVKINPDYANAHNNLANDLLLRGEYHEAVKHSQEALRVAPDFAEAHYNLGLGLHALGHLRSAMTEYREALRLRPQYAEAHYNLGIALATDGQPNEAISQYRKAIKIKPDLPGIRVRLDNLLRAEKKEK